MPDEKLQVLTDLNKSEKTVPATLEFVDVAGLIKGASSGEGLGNQFLASIRQCDAVVHVVCVFFFSLVPIHVILADYMVASCQVRCFDSEDVIHVSVREVLA